MIFFLYLICIFLLILSPISAVINYGNSTIVHVSGYPQSGTTIMTAILGALEGIRTMKGGCDGVHGAAHCKRFNYEGQWLLRDTAAYRSGGMCAMEPSSDAQSKSIEQDITSTYERMWMHSSSSSDSVQGPETIFLQKSPQDMLKIPVLRHAYRTAKAVLFVVVMKHPMTVNYNRNMFWDPMRIKHESAFVKNVDMVKHYLNESIKEARVPPLCAGNTRERGWLASTEQLYTLLRRDRSQSLKDTLVIRFEDTRRPQALCGKLVDFVASGGAVPEGWVPNGHARCATLFKFGERQKRKSRRSRHDSNRFELDPVRRRHRHRRLGMHEVRSSSSSSGNSGYNGAHKQHSVVIERSTSGLAPFHFFLSAFRRLPKAKRAILQAFDEGLSRFGYSMRGVGLLGDGGVLAPWMRVRQA